MTADTRDNDIKQQLSALVDGELGRDQARFMLRRLPDDPELSGCWQRWHVAGEALRGGACAPVRAEFVAKVALAIANDAAPGRAISRDALKWIGGFAVAASVALVALMAVRPAADVPNASGQVPLVAVDPAPAPQVALSPYREEQLRAPLREAALPVAVMDAESYGEAVRIDPAIERYLVRHNEATQQQGFVSYLPLVTPVRERTPVAGSSR